MKKNIVLVLVAVIMVTLFAGCAETAETMPEAAMNENTGIEAAVTGEETKGTKADGEKPLICYLINKTNSAFTAREYEAFQEHYQDWPEVEWKYFDAQADVVLQGQQVDEAIALGADVVILHSVDSTASVAYSKKLQEAGVKVVASCVKFTDDAYMDAFHGSDAYDLGQKVADSMHERFPEGCNYVHLAGDPSHENARMRNEGFRDRSEEKGYNFNCLGDSPNCDWQSEKGKVYMNDFLSKFSGQIDAVFALDDSIGFGGMQAIQEDRTGENGDILIFSIGGTEAVLNAIDAEEYFYSTTYQSAEVEALGAMEIAVEMAKGNTPEKYNMIDSPVITKANVAEYGPAF